MAAEANLTRTLTKAQNIDFVNQFGKGIAQLTELMGVTRLMPMAAGTLIKTYKSSVTLDGTAVAPGDVIPLSEVKLEEDASYELVFDKKRKAVAVEDIQKYGFEKAITITDEKLIREQQSDIRNSFFEQLATGKGTATGAGLQAALAQGFAKVVTAFEDDIAQTIAFINPEDLAAYQASHVVTLESAFGLQYLKNFLGYDIVIVSSKVAKGKAYATVTNNLVFAYASINGEIDKAFDFVADGKTPMLGVAHDINYSRLTSETITLSATKLFAEMTGGVVVISITAVGA